MRAIALAFIVLAIELCQAFSSNAYQGIRFTVRKDLVEAKHFENCALMAQQILHMTFPRVNYTIGPEYFKTSFVIANLSGVSAVYDPTKQTEYVFLIGGDKTINMTQVGPVLNMTFHFTYDFVVLGMHLLFGEGTLNLTASKLVVFETYKERDIVTTVKANLIPTIKISGLNFFYKVTPWIEFMFTEYLYNDLIDRLTNIFHTNMMNDVAPLMNQAIEFYKSGALTVLLEHSILTMNESPAGYLSLGFNANIRVDDRQISKKIWRYVNTPVTMAGEKAKLCVANTLIPNVVEVQGKAKDFMLRLDPKDFGLSGKLRDLAPIMPKIYEYFDTELELEMACRVIGDMDIVKIATNPSLEQTAIQIPISCAFAIYADPHRDLLDVNMYVRANITKIQHGKPQEIVLSGSLNTPFIYGLNVASSMFPVEGIDTVYAIMGRVARKLQGFPIVAPGLKFLVNIDSGEPIYTPGAEEDCFTFA